MELARPYSCIAPTLEGDVLAVLAGLSTGITGREVARLVKRGSQRGVLAALQRLVDQGLVLQAEAGRSLLFRLNRDHLAAPLVEGLATLRTQLFERLRGLIESWEVAPVHASVFGSVARGDGDLTSDVDLFIVRPSEVDSDDSHWRSQLDDFPLQVLRWTGNRAGISEVSTADVQRLGDDQPRIVGDLRRDAVRLVGSDVSELLGAA